MKKHISLIVVLSCCLWFAAGCGGGSDGGSAAVTPTVTTDLTGTLTVPTTVNSGLLTRIVAAQSTDSDVRTAFANASIWVNDVQAANRVISPSAVDTTWDFRILGVPQSAAGIYKIQLLVGKLGLKSWVSAANKDAFVMNSQTTAAALLAEHTGMSADGLIATFPAMVSRVAKQIDSAFNASTTIPFTISAPGEMNLTVYDALGREIQVLGAGDWGLGEHSVVWNAGNQASGVYMVRLSSGESSQTMKLMLVK